MRERARRAPPLLHRSLRRGRRGGGRRRGGARGRSIRARDTRKGTQAAKQALSEATRLVTRRSRPCHGAPAHIPPPPLPPPPPGPCGMPQAPAVRATGRKPAPGTRHDTRRDVGVGQRRKGQGPGHLPGAGTQTLLSGLRERARVRGRGRKGGEREREREMKKERERASK